MIFWPSEYDQVSPLFVTSTWTAGWLLPSLLTDCPHSLSPRISKCQSVKPPLLSTCHRGTSSIALRTTSAFIGAAWPDAADMAAQPQPTASPRSFYAFRSSNAIRGIAAWPRERPAQRPSCRSAWLHALPTYCDYFTPCGVSICRMALTSCSLSNPAFSSP